MSDIMFASRAIAVKELESIGYRVERIGSRDCILSAVIPQNVPADYPRVPYSKAPFPVASLFDDGILSMRNEYEPAVAQHHERLRSLLKPKDPDEREKSTVSFHLTDSLN